MRRKLTYMADDGTVCDSLEEMEEINKRVDKLFTRDRLAWHWDMYISREKSEWFRWNVTQRGARRNTKRLEELMK